MFKSNGKRYYGTLISIKKIVKFIYRILERVRRYKKVGRRDF